jgi:magnesium-transporting ATPase (P-type)
MSTIIKKNDKSCRIHCKGASEMVSKLCTRIYVLNENIEKNNDNYDKNVFDEVENNTIYEDATESCNCTSSSPISFMHNNSDDINSYNPENDPLKNDPNIVMIDSTITEEIYSVIGFFYFFL